MTTIIKALKDNQFKEAEQLIIKGHTLNEQDETGLTALHLATLKGRTELVRKLLAAGSDPNIRTEQEDVYDETNTQHQDPEIIMNTLRNLGNKTPLHIAAKEGLHDIGKMLIENGADINSVDSGLCTPLHWSAACGDEIFVEILLRNNANPNVRDLASSTPLHEATRNNHRHVVALLMQYNANPYIKDISEQCAYEIAQTNVQLLSVFHCFLIQSSKAMH